MKVICVVGPYRAATRTLVIRNIEIARRAALAVNRCGATAYCSHLNTAHFDLDGIEDEHILAGGLEMLRRCDAVILCGAWWRHSEGTQAEIQLAYELGLPVFSGERRYDDLEAWLAAPDQSSGTVPVTDTVENERADDLSEAATGAVREREGDRSKTGPTQEAKGLAERAVTESCPRCCSPGSRMDFLGVGAEDPNDKPDLAMGLACCTEQNPCGWRKSPEQSLEDHDMLVLSVETLQRAVTRIEKKCRMGDAETRPWKHWIRRPWVKTWVINDVAEVLGEVAERFIDLADRLEAKEIKGLLNSLTK